MPVDITYTLGARGVARFDVKDTQVDTSTAYRPTIDELVTVSDGTTALFSGAALRVRDRAAVDPRRGVITAVDAADFVRALDARIVTASYPAGQTLKQVVSDLRTTYLAVFGITLDSGMADGPTLEALDFTGATITAIFNQLSDVTGWVWRVLPTKVLEFFAVGTKTAPYSLTSSTATIIGGVQWTKSRGKFVNRQWVKYGTVGERQVPESFTATAGQTIFPLTYPPFAYSGTVNVGGTLNADGTITGGTNETASYVGGGGTWEFDLTAETMTRSAGLSVGSVVNVIYPVLFPLMASAEDAASVTALGPWEDVVDRPDIFDKPRAEAEAAGLLRRYKATPREITVRTRAGLVFPGDVITLTIPERTVSGSWLITAVRITNDIDQRFTYDLTCLEGTEAQASWIDYWRSALGGGSTGSSGTINGFGVIPGTTSSAGTGTVNTLAKWVSTSTLGDVTGVTESGGLLTLAPSGDLVLDPGGNDVLPSVGYDINLGMLSKKYLSLHAAELWVETLVAQNTLATIGGRVLVAPTNLLTADCLAAASTVTVKYNNLSNADGGDVIYLEADGKVEFMRVVSGATGGAGAYVYSVTRNLDGSGANDWYAGDAVLNTGVVGDGFIDLYSLRGVKAGTEIGPTIVGNVRNSTTYNDWAPRWAVGNLNGLYGYSADTYGAAFGVPTAAWIKIDPINGIRIGHNTTTKISLSAAGDASFAGSISAADGTIGGFTIIPNYLYSGATGATRVALSSDGVDAMWAGAVNAVDAPFRVTAGGALTATSAVISGTVTTGNLSATGGSIGGWTIAATTLTGGNATLASSGNLTLGTGNDVFRASADDATYRTWIGNATASSAPFRVTKGGSLTASDATVTGNITANTLDANGGTMGGLTVDGTITVGSGGSVVAGGGNVTLGPGGLTLTAGTGASNQIIWSNGATIHGWGGTSTLTLNASVTEVNQTFKVYGATIEFGTIGADTGTALVLNASSLVKTDSSSERYKQNVQPLATNPSAILGAKPIRFDFRDGTRDVVGFSAEQVASVAPELVNLDAKGRPDSLRLQGMLAYVVALLQANDKRLTALEAR